MSHYTHDSNVQASISPEKNYNPRSRGRAGDFEHFVATRSWQQQCSKTMGRESMGTYLERSWLMVKWPQSDHYRSGVQYPRNDQGLNIMIVTSDPVSQTKNACVHVRVHVYKTHRHIVMTGIGEMKKDPYYSHHIVHLSFHHLCTGKCRLV